MLFETTHADHPTFPDTTGVAGGGGRGIQESPLGATVSEEMPPEPTSFPLVVRPL